MAVHEPETLKTVEYRKSTYSSGAQQCVAVGFAKVRVGVKDTKNPDVLLSFTALGFSQLVRALHTDQR
jgi:hypothetical protein